MHLIDFIVGFLVIWVGLMALMALSFLFLRAPYVPTPWKVTRTMVDFAELKGDEVVYDLGAGDARLLIAAKEKYPKVIAKGFELAFPVYLMGLFRVWASGHAITYRLKNFFHQNVSDADCIFLYLMPGAMKNLQKKFEKELKPGTKIVSHAFRFPDREPIKTVPVPWLSGTKNVMLYEW